MDVSFSDLINLPSIFKFIVVRIAQLKLIKSFFSQKNAVVHGKTSKENVMMSKIHQMHARVN